MLFITPITAMATSNKTITSVSISITSHQTIYGNNRIDNEYQFQVNYMTSYPTCQLVFNNFLRFYRMVSLAFQRLSI